MHLPLRCQPVERRLNLRRRDALQVGLASKVQKSRKQMKERKNRSMKVRGVKKVSWLSRPPAICSVHVTVPSQKFRSCFILHSSVLLVLARRSSFITKCGR